MAISHQQLYQSHQVSCSGGIRLGTDGQVVLITSEESVYQDELTPCKNECLFRAQGLVGDQSWSNPRNSRLRDLLLSEGSVPLYEKIAVNEYELLGNYYLYSDIYTGTEPGEDGTNRTVFIFPLQRVNDN
jgi:5-methylcytosine-specific restriction enzyme A